MKILQTLKIIVLTPFAFWVEIVSFVFGVSILVIVIWFWVLVIKALLKYLAS